MKLEALAFALLIGGQFLAAIVSISKRAQLYPDSGRPNVDQDRLRPTEPTRFVARIARRRFSAVPTFTP
jgi:hypothetical protein